MTNQYLEREHGGHPAGPTLRQQVDQRVQLTVAASPGLLDGRHQELRRAVLEVASAGLVAADPEAATHRNISYDAEADIVTIAGRAYPMWGKGNVVVVGAGKASYGIAVALEDVLGARLAGGVVAVRDPEAVALRRIQVLCTDHPLPTERSVDAARRILDCVADTTEHDLVVACFTGGSSALASLPPEGVTPDDKRALHHLLLASGLAITKVNAVRKQVSAIKGGRVAIAAAPSRVVNLTVSDVAGGALDTITDPTVQDSSDAAAARAVLRDHGLWHVVPAAVRSHLERDLPTPSVSVQPQTVMLADGASTVRAMSTAASERGFHPIEVKPDVEGDADDVGAALAQRLLDECALTDRPVMLIGCGGESVVKVATPAGFGRGGPNQHAALRATQVLAGHRAVALFVDTDGSDGGTDLAGGLIDGATSDLAQRLGVDVPAALQSQQSREACIGLGSGVRTGHTGTNVNDLFVLAAHEGAS